MNTAVLVLTGTLLSSRLRLCDSTSAEAAAAPGVNEKACRTVCCSRKRMMSVFFIVSPHH